MQVNKFKCVETVSCRWAPQKRARPFLHRDWISVLSAIQTIQLGQKWNTRFAIIEYKFRSRGFPRGNSRDTLRILVFSCIYFKKIDHIFILTYIEVKYKFLRKFLFYSYKGFLSFPLLSEFTAHGLTSARGILFSGMAFEQNFFIGWQTGLEPSASSFIAPRNTIMSVKSQ